MEVSNLDGGRNVVGMSELYMGGIVERKIRVNREAGLIHFKKSECY